MPVLSTEHGSVALVHIPKTGGTSLVAAFESVARIRYLTVDARPYFTEARQALSLRVVPQHLTLEGLRLLLAGDLPEARVAVIRDPYDRLESEFHYQRRLRGEIGAFGDWALESLYRASVDPSHAEGHFRPQSAFFDDSVRVFRLEDGLQAAVDHVAGALGVEAPEAPQLNRSSREPEEWSAPLIREFNRFYAGDLSSLGYPRRPDAPVSARENSAYQLLKARWLAMDVARQAKRRARVLWPPGRLPE